MTFLYIFEDGTYGVSPDGPSDGDVLAMQDGLLTVLHSDSEIKEFHENGASSSMP